MLKKILKEIKKYETIVIARHIGVDPDAFASQVALRDSLRLSFPNKKVMAVGTGSNKFNYIGKLDKLEMDDKTLLIVLDTPGIRRIDISKDLKEFKSIIKIDHHPFVDKLSDLEYIDTKASSTCEIIMKFLDEVGLACNEEIAEVLYMGLIADTNRFFNSTTPNTFSIVSKYLRKYKFNMKDIYQKFYLRDLKEVRFEGYISENMIVTEDKVGYIKITDKLLKKFEVDAAASGNMVNDFNFIDGILVWATITEDVKNEIIRVSIRSRGPEINKIAENYAGGGHKYASGARLKTMKEADKLIADLNSAVRDYLDKEENDGN